MRRRLLALTLAAEQRQNLGGLWIGREGLGWLGVVVNLAASGRASLDQAEQRRAIRETGEKIGHDSAAPC
jgi:hypothetical protein